MKRWLGIGIGAAALFAVMLVVTLPAERAYGRLVGELPGLKAERVEGTVWSGTARGVAYGLEVIETVHWRVRPLQAVTGRLAVDVTATTGDGRADGRVLVGMNDMLIRDMEVTLDAARLAPVLEPHTELRFGGTVDVTIDTARIDSRTGTLVDGRGTARWRDAAVKGNPPVPLGGIIADATIADDAVTLRIQDDGGPLRADGDGRIEAGGRYHFTIDLQSRDGASSELQTLLGAIAPPDEAGITRVEEEGELAL